LGDITNWIANEALSMIEIAPGCCREGTAHGAFDPEGFARGVRTLAIDAYRALTFPDVAGAELTRLKRRAEGLLLQTQVRRTAEMDRWLRNIGRAIDVRLGYAEKVGLGAGRKGADVDERRGEATIPRLRLFAWPKREENRLVRKKYASRF
jgi:hypothetical protein